MSISLQLPGGTVTTEHMPALIGRALEADIKIPEMHNSVSRNHARIYLSAGRYYIEDLGSSNGTKVDGIRIAGPTPLTPSCRLSLGEVEGFLTLTPLQSVSPDTSGGVTIVQQNPLMPPAPAPHQAAAPPHSQPAQQYAPPAHSPIPQPPSPKPPYRPSGGGPRPLVPAPAWSDDAARLKLHRYLAWGAVGLMFLSFTMPWVKAGAFGMTFQLNYFRMIKELARATDAAGQFGLEMDTTAVFLPLLAFVLALAAGTLNHALPIKQSTVASAIGGGVGLMTGYGIYSYASSGIGLDVSGALAGGFHLFCFAAIVLLGEALVMQFLIKSKQTQ